MKTGQTVATSYTQKEIERYAFAEKAIQHVFSISAIDVSLLKARISYEMVQRLMPWEAERILNDDYFAAWFHLVWIADDIGILNNPINTNVSYEEMKQAIIEDDRIAKLFIQEFQN